MDIANKTEKISAPDNKHDDYCDSSVMAIHAALSMLPAEGTFATVSIENKSKFRTSKGNRGITGLLTTRNRKNSFNKRTMRGI
jgi:hypothetical protein